MDIGAHLRGARERQGKTLRQIANATKLSTTALQHIERNQFNRLPGGIFTRGYLRAYAVEACVNPEEIVREYLLQFPNESMAKPLTEPAGSEHSHLRSYGVTATVAICGVVLAYGPRGESVPSPAPTQELIEVPSLLASGQAERIVSEIRRAAELDDRLHLEIQSKGPCWISLVADGQRTLYRLLLRGERASATARDELVLRVGDPAVFAYTLNGEPGRRLGDAQTPITVIITSSNYRTFLAGSSPEA